MDWGWWIPLIAVGIWIIVNVVRGLETARKEMPAPRPVDRPRPASDIDRFLEEINRRRQEQEQRRPVEPPPVRRQKPIPRSSQRPQRPAPSRPRRPVAEPMVAMPVPAAEPIPEVLPALPVESALPAAHGSLRVTIPTLPLPQRGVLPAHLVELQRLLGSAQGLQAAVLAEQILGPPRSRRRLGRR